MAVVLVVEDEGGIAELLADTLTDEGHRVLLASNGREAIAIAGRARPDLIVTDFMMPVMDGPALIRALADDPMLRNIPVALMSAMPESIVAARTDGYVLFFQKPFRLADLIIALKKLL